jgi:hypothetical protein
LRLGRLFGRDTEGQILGTSKKTLFDPSSDTPFQLSRYRLERSMDCPRCFWLELRKGLKRLEPHPYTLNGAVDRLVKKEFDVYRERQEPHPIMTEFGIVGVPWNDPRLKDWRLTVKGKGMRFLHTETNLDIMGAPDDIWLVGEVEKRVAIVDTKATSSKTEHPIEDDWWRSYRRQLDIYVWLLERMDPGHPVSPTGYFLLLNGQAEASDFGLRLQFKPKVIPYHTDPSWVESAIRRAHACLIAPEPPASADACELCQYRRTARELEG